MQIPELDVKTPRWIPARSGMQNSLHVSPSDMKILIAYSEILFWGCSRTKARSNILRFFLFIRQRCKYDTLEHSYKSPHFFLFIRQRCMRGVRRLAAKAEHVGWHPVCETRCRRLIIVVGSFDSICWDSIVNYRVPHFLCASVARSTLALAMTRVPNTCIRTQCWCEKSTSKSGSTLSTTLVIIFGLKYPVWPLSRWAKQ